MNAGAHTRLFRSHYGAYVGEGENTETPTKMSSIRYFLQKGGIMESTMSMAHVNELLSEISDDCILLHCDIDVYESLLNALNAKDNGCEIAELVI